jgi:hypothetical protein
MPRRHGRHLDSRHSRAAAPAVRRALPAAPLPPTRVVAEGAADVGRRVGHRALRERRDEAGAEPRAPCRPALNEQLGGALVVSRYVGVGIIHARRVQREPVEQPPRLASGLRPGLRPGLPGLRLLVDPQQRHRLVGVVGVAGALLWGVGLVRGGGPGGGWGGGWGWGRGGVGPGGEGVCRGVRLRAGRRRASGHRGRRAAAALAPAPLAHALAC